MTLLEATGSKDLTASGRPWQEVAEAYLDAAIDSPNTRRAYTGAIGSAMRHAGVATLDELTGAQLAAWRAEVTNTPGVSPATVAQRLAGLRSFLSWAGTMGAHHLPQDVIRAGLKTPRGDVRKPYQVLSEPEIGAILIAATTARDRALLAVMLGAGLRVSELVALDVQSIIEDQDGATSLYVSSGKGRRSRTVPVQPEVAAVLRAYLQATGRRLGQPGALFRAHDRGAGKRNRPRLTARAVGYLVEKLCTGMGIEARAISPHSLRHSYSIRTLRYSGNVVAISKLLGHSQLTTTQRYVDHLAQDELRETVPALPM